MLISALSHTVHAFLNALGAIRSTQNTFEELMLKSAAGELENIRFCRLDRPHSKRPSRIRASATFRRSGDTETIAAFMTSIARFESR
jgi:hypothetical protein